MYISGPPYMSRIISHAICSTQFGRTDYMYAICSNHMSRIYYMSHHNTRIPVYTLVDLITSNSTVMYGVIVSHSHTI